MYFQNAHQRILRLGNSVRFGRVVPDAQLPLATPLPLLHSSLVMQVPLVELSELAVHTSCWKGTTKKSDVKTRPIEMTVLVRSLKSSIFSSTSAQLEKKNLLGSGDCTWRRIKVIISQSDCSGRLEIRPEITPNHKKTKKKTDPNFSQRIYRKGDSPLPSCS